MADTIDSLISRKAIEEIFEADEGLQKLYKTMEDLYAKLIEAMKAVEQAKGVKEMTSNLDQQVRITEELNKTNSERLQIERDIKREGDKMVAAIRSEVDEQKKLNKVLEENTNNVYESADLLARQRKSLELTKEAIKKLKDEYKLGNIVHDEYKGRMTDLVLKEREQKIAISATTKELDQSIKENQAVSESMDQKAITVERLRSLLKSLSDEERLSAETGGILQSAINRLDEELKAFDKTIGQNYRNVGNYEIATKTVKTEVLNLSNAIAEQSLENRAIQQEIQKEIKLRNEHASTLGKDSIEYKASAQRVAELQLAQKKGSETMLFMKEKAGELRKELNLSQGAIKAASDSANLFQTISQGVATISHGFAAYQAITSLVGEKNEELAKSILKVQAAMSLANSVQQIANNLKAQGALRTGIENIVDKVKLAFLKARIKSEKDLAASVATATTAEYANTTATAANTTATAAGTKANKTYALSFKTIGNAIKSIPGIGWILAAVAGAATLIALTYKYLTAEKELTRQERILIEVQKQRVEIEQEVTRSTKETEVRLKAYMIELEKVKQGSKQWNNIVKAIAKETGLSYDYLVKHPDKIKEITDAWIEQYKKRAIAEATFRKIAEREIDLHINIQDLSNIESGTKEFDEKLKELGISMEKFEEITELFPGEIPKIGDSFGKLTEYVKSESKKLNDELLKSIDFNTLFTPLEGEGKSAVDDRVKYLSDILKKIEELEAKTDLQILELKKKRITEEYEANVKKYGELQAAKKLYDLQIEQLDKEFLNKQIERIDNANKEALKVYDELNEIRLKNGNISEEQLTAELLKLEQKRHKLILAENKKAFEKEVEGLEVSSAEYLAIKKKWDALNEKQAHESTQRDITIRKEGFDQYIAKIKQEAEDFKNASIIEKGRGLTSDEEGEIRIQAISAEIKELESLEKTYESIGMTQEEYYSKILSLKAQLAQESEAQHQREMQRIEEEIKQRQMLAMAVSDSLVIIGNALADGVESEKQRVVIQQSLALAQILLNEGIAMSEAIGMVVAKGDPYTAAMRIASAVSAITAGFITAKNAITQSKQATSQVSNLTYTAYAKGTDHHKGGDALVAEAGEPEIVNIGDKQYVFDQPTYIKDLAVGAKVMPIHDVIRNYKMSYNEFEYRKLDEIKNELIEMKNKPTVEVNVGRSVITYLTSQHNKARILNKKFKIKGR